MSDETIGTETVTSPSDVPDAPQQTINPSSEPASSSGSTENPSLPTSATESPAHVPATSSKCDAPDRIELLLRPVGDAPIAKQQKWKVDPKKKLASPMLTDIAWVLGFFKRYLKLNDDQQRSLVFFVNQCFAPSPDQTLENLYSCFGTDDGKLTLHYCLTMAWG